MANLGAALDLMVTRLAGDALARAAGARFKRVMDGTRMSGVLELEPQVKLETGVAYTQFRSTIRSVMAVLERGGAAPAARRLDSLATDFEPFVRCTRKDTAEMTEFQWRRSFATALAATVAQIGALLREHASLFDIVRVPAESDFTIVDIPIAVSEGETAPLVSSTTLSADYGRSLYEKALQSTDASVFDVPATGNVRYQIWLDDAGPLASAQWERLHDGREFIALRRATSIARAVAAQSASAALTNSLPLRVLVTISAPNGVDPLDGGSERAALEAALGPLIVLGWVELQFAPDGRLETLRRLLRTGSDCRRPVHIWHFIGHGAYDHQTDSSTLIMETDARKVHRVGGDELGFLLRSYGPLSAVVLNSCHGAHGSASWNTAVPGRALAAAGVPAVVAMQSTIRDDAAKIFSEELYGSLCDGRSIDAAVAEGRRRLFLSPGVVRTEWATPVLFVAAARNVGKMVSGKPQI